MPVKMAECLQQRASCRLRNTTWARQPYVCRAGLQACDGLVDPIAAYFEKVFVMSEDVAVRQSRLALLRDIASLPHGILDFAELPGF